MDDNAKIYSKADIKRLLDEIRNYSITVIVTGEPGTPEQESDILNQAIKDAVDYGEEWFFQTH